MSNCLSFVSSVMETLYVNFISFAYKNFFTLDASRKRLSTDGISEVAAKQSKLDDGMLC